MRIRLVVLAALSLVGCSDPVKDAERELQIIESTGGSDADICTAKRKVAAVYLKAQKAKAYETARVSADVHCMNAEFRQQLGN